MRVRRTARIVLLGPDNRVLLVKIDDATVKDRDSEVTNPFWVTPGGQLEPGEAPRAAVLRELREEIGHDEVDLGPQIWRAEHVLDWRGEAVRFEEDFFFGRTRRADIATDRHTAEEREVVADIAWWRAEDVAQARVSILPGVLVAALPGLIAGEIPKTPTMISLSAQRRL